MIQRIKPKGKSCIWGERINVLDEDSNDLNVTPMSLFDGVQYFGQKDLSNSADHENGLGRLTDRVLLNVHRDMELVAEPVLIRTFNNPAEIVRICENEIGKSVLLIYYEMKKNERLRILFCYDF